MFVSDSWRGIPRIRVVKINIANRPANEATALNDYFFA
jgi:hypothetical protein